MTDLPVFSVKLLKSL